MKKTDWAKMDRLAKDAGYVLEKNEDGTCNLFDPQCDYYIRNISANVAMLMIESMIKLLEDNANA